MKLKLAVILMMSMAFSLSSFGQTTEIEGVNVPNTLKAGDMTLVLNGGGVREKMWIDLYVGALYLPVKMTNAKVIVAADNAMAIRLEIVSSMITSEKMTTAVEEGFSNSCDDKETLRTEIDKFTAAFDEAIKDGDIFVLEYTPKGGTKVIKNGTTVETIKGVAFKRALFGIWLGEDPADDDLKDGMMGS